MVQVDLAEALLVIVHQLLEQELQIQFKEMSVELEQQIVIAMRMAVGAAALEQQEVMLLQGLAVTEVMV